MTRSEVRARIKDIGIIPAIRVGSADDALFAAEAVARGGIAIVEVTMTVPGALEVVARLLSELPEMVVGAGTVLDGATAARCVQAGVHFLTSPGLIASVVEVAAAEDVVAMPGALTPTEVATAWKAGVDFVKVFPCGQVGGASYIRALRGPFPQVALVAAGGVTQQTAADYVAAGATALGIGGDLIPREAIEERHGDRIEELAHRFLGMVRGARKH